jgi:hypothetical protein
VVLTEAKAVESKTSDIPTDIPTYILDGKFYKVINTDFTHKGFKYQLGMNVDTKPFNPTGSCKPGGLYYTDLKHLPKYLGMGRLLATVEPKGDVYEDPPGGKWKTDRLLVKSIMPVSKWINEQSEEMKQYIIGKNGSLLYLIDNPSEEIKLCAVRSCNTALNTIKNPSDAIKLEAVRSHGWAIKYIENPSEELQLLSVKQKPGMLRHIKNPSEKVILAAIAVDSVKALSYGIADTLSEEDKMKAVMQNGESIKYFRKSSHKLRLAAVRQDGNNIAYICNPDVLIFTESITQNPYTLKYINEPSEELQLAAVELNGSVILFIKNPSKKVQLAAIAQNPYAFYEIASPCQSAINAFNATGLNGVQVYKED